MRSAGAYVGPSGWSYPSWKQFLPPGLPASQRLHHLSRVFNSIEINGSFYKQISNEVYADWDRATPPDFRFALKGHRFVTHYRHLANCADPISRLRAQASGLGRKLAVVLWQLPASAALNLERLDDFLAVLRDGWGDVRHAFEFRHRTWFIEEVRERLTKAGAAVCIADAPDFPSWDVVTTDLVYVRLHGHTRKYASSYSPSDLHRWAGRIRDWLSDGHEVHVYFDNDAEGAALANAQSLREMLST